MADGWHCLFETEDDLVLRTVEAYDSPEEAAMWGQRIILRPEGFDLHDPDDETVSATEIDVERGFTIEDGEGDSEHFEFETAGEEPLDPEDD